MKRGPWTIKSSRVIHQTKWVKVLEDEVIRPDGTEGEHTVIEMKHGITILPIDNERNVYLAKEFKYAVSRYTLEAISGGIDKDEDKLQAAKRELKEELGAEAGKWTDMGVVDPFTTVINSPNYIYLAEDLHFTEHKREGTETIEMVKVPLKEAVKKVGNEITHGASCVVISKAFHYLEA